MTILQSCGGEKEGGEGCTVFDACRTALLPCQQLRKRSPPTEEKTPSLNPQDKRTQTCAAEALWLSHKAASWVDSTCPAKTAARDGTVRREGLNMGTLSPRTPAGSRTRLQGQNWIQDPKGCWQRCWQCSCNPRAVPCRGCLRRSVAWDGLFREAGN